MSIKEDLNFEKALKELEHITNQLKDGKISLEESLNLYEEGIEYYKICSEKLTQADQKIQFYNKDIKALEETR